MKSKASFSFSPIFPPKVIAINNLGGGGYTEVFTYTYV